MWQKNACVQIKEQFYRVIRYYSSLFPRVLENLFEKDMLSEYYGQVADWEDQVRMLKILIFNTILTVMVLLEPQYH